MINLYKKAISPVVATALLLVVAVVAVVGFQTWFNTYQSDIVTDVESRSDTGASITIERLEGTTTPKVYYKNSGSSDIDVTEIKILSSGATICKTNTSSGATANVSTDASASSVNSSIVAMNTSNGIGGNCVLTNGNTYNVVITTANGVFSENEVAR